MPFYNTYRGSKSLPRKRSQSPKHVVVPFRSAYPAQLQEFSSSMNNQLDYTDDDAAGTPSTGLGHVSPFRTRTMKEYDQQISDLKKENFSLKLRIYFLEEKMQQKYAANNNGGNGKEEDVGKANIELKVELESLKRDLADKQDLLCSASQALETLESQHRIETKSMKDACQKEKLDCERRIDELEKRLEMMGGGSSAVISKSHSEEWFRQAFSIADLTADNNERSDTQVSSLQQKISGLEAMVAELNDKIQTYEETIREMKSVAETKDERVAKLEESKAKRDNAIRALMEAVQDKNAECEDLNKRLEVQSEETSRTMRNIGSASLPTHDRVSVGQRSESPSVDAVFQHETLLFEMQVKDNRIRDLCVELDRMQTELKKLADDGVLREDELVTQLRDSLSTAERNSKELSARTETLEGLKVEKELKKAKDALRELETDLMRKSEENTSFYNRLLENKDSMAELREKLRIRDEYLDKIGSCVDKLLIEDIDSKNEDSNRDDVSKMAGILSRMTSLCARLDNSGRKPISPPPLPSPSSELHHLDLIRDSNHAASPETTAAALMAANARLKKELAEAKTRAEEAADTNRVLLERMQEGAAASRNREDIDGKMTEKLNDCELGTISELKSGDASEDQLVEDEFPSQETNEAEAEINRLKFILRSTEGTVRMLSNKLKHYRLLLCHAGVSLPFTRSKTSLCGDINVEGPSTERTECFLSVNVPTISKSASFSAPVTPSRASAPALEPVGSPPGPSYSQQEELDALRHAVADRDLTLRDLRSQIGGLVAMRPTLVDAWCQSDLAEDSSRLARDADSCRNVVEDSRLATHRTCEVLRRRLEELADFLESLLQFDGNGTSLDLSSLTPRKLASIRGQLEETRELSRTVSLSLMAMDNSTLALSALSEMSDTVPPRTMAHGSPSDSTTTTTATPGRGYVTPVNSVRKSCSRNLSLGGGHRESAGGDHQGSTMEDNFLLVLRPNTTTTTTNGFLRLDAEDELPTCSLFGAHHSFLSSTNVMGSGRKRCEEQFSESDSWSEPDRRVSRQRIGLESQQVTPVGGAAAASNTESEEVATAEINGYVGSRSRSSRSQASPGKGNPRSSLSTHAGSPMDATPKQDTYSPPAKPQRRVRSRSGEYSPLGRGGSVGRTTRKVSADGHLREIAERKSVDGSIQGGHESPKGNVEPRKEHGYVFDKLYEQLEDSKAQLDNKNLMLQNAMKDKAALLAEVEHLTEKFESYRETIESLQSLLEEQQKAAKESSRRAERLEAASAEQERALVRAKRLVFDNETALKNLRDLAEGLEAERDRLKGRCERTEREARRLQEERDELANGRVPALQHSLAAREEDVRRMAEDARVNHAAVLREVEEAREAKQELESRLSDFQTRLDAETALTQALKSELQTYVDRQEDGRRPAQKSSSSDGLHLDIGQVILRGSRSGSEPWPPCPVSSPDTASSFSYVSGGCWNNHADVYSSPDLGIESDRSRLSSLDRKNPSYSSAASLKSPAYLQPGFPAGCGAWPMVNSAPPRLNPGGGGEAEGTGGKDARCPNMTFPACGKGAAEEETGESGTDCVTDGRMPYAVSFPADLGALKKSLRDGVNLLRAVRRKAKERLLKLKTDGNTMLGNTTVRDEEYAAWKETYLGCDALKGCLIEGCRLTAKFWTAPLPMLVEDASVAAGCELSQVGGHEQELMRLYHELAKEKQRAEAALEKLEAAKRREAKMERFIVKELKKTHCVLKKTSGQMEQQQAKCISSPSPQKS